MLLPDSTHAAWDELREALPLHRWAEAVRVIAARHALPAAEPTMFPSGSDVVMRVGDAVVKLSEPRWRHQIEMEAAMLRRVQGRLPLQTPPLLATGELEGWPYVVMGVVQGEPLASVWETLPASNRVSLAREMGGLLRALAALPVSEEDRRTWPPFFASMRDGVLDRLSRRRKPPSERWLREIVPFLASTPLSDAPLCWMHTELLGEHLLVRERDGRWELCALLDFADAAVGHPFYEIPAVAEFLFKGEQPLMRELLLAAGVEESRLGTALSRELCAWSLLHQFASVVRLLDACGAPEPSSFSDLSERLYRF